MAQQTLNTPRETTHQRIAAALEAIEQNMSDEQKAVNIDYDNIYSGLSADNVQEAIDELSSEKANTADLGTAASKDVPTSGNATSTQVVMGNDSRLTDARPASDVSAWAKASTKPTYTASEVGAYTKTESDNKYVAKETGKGLSTNDYTTADKNKLAGIEAGANKTVVDSSMSDSSTNPLQNKVITKELEGAKTTSGNPITVTDCAPVNAVNLSMDLEPIQDLHGYDHPWVGGAGKNKLNIPLSVVTTEVNGITFTVTRNTEGSVLLIDADGTVSGADATIDFTVSGMPLTDVILNGCPQGGGNDTYQIIRWNNSWGNVQRDNGNGVTYTNTTDENILRLRVKQGVTVNHIKFYPMIRLSTETDSSFAPYSNICPISGRSEVEIDRVGVNWVEDRLIGANIGSNGQIGSDSTYDLAIAKIIKGVTYTITTNDSAGFVGGYFINKPTSQAISYNGQRIVSANKTFTALIDGYIAFRTLTGYATPQLEFGSTATTYEPYKGKTYTIQFGQTVYGGQLDATKGELVVDTAEVTYDGSSDENWDGTSQVHGILIDSRYSINQIPIANYFKGTTPKVASNLNIGEIALTSSLTAMNVYTLSSGVADWRTYLASNPLQVCYELATPITIQLTPQQIKLLENTNTIYTDYEGDTITIEYQPNNAVGKALASAEEGYDAQIEHLKNTTEINPVTNLYLEKSGNVINIEARDVDGSAFTTYPGAGGYTLPTGYRPKRMLIVCVYVYTTYDNKNHHGIIKIRDDGTMDGYFIDFSGNEHKVYDSSYSSSVSFNTSYIV